MHFGIVLPQNTLNDTIFGKKDTVFGKKDTFLSYIKIGSIQLLDIDFFWIIPCCMTYQYILF